MFQTHSKFPLQKTIFWTDLFRSVNPPQLQLDNCFWGGVKLGDIPFGAGQGKQQPNVCQISSSKWYWSDFISSISYHHIHHVFSFKRKLIIADFYHLIYYLIYHFDIQITQGVWRKMWIRWEKQSLVLSTLAMTPWVMSVWQNNLLPFI